MGLRLLGTMSVEDFPAKSGNRGGKAGAGIDQEFLTKLLAL
jgi:hypothetical protein